MPGSARTRCDRQAGGVPVRVAIVTLDGHMASAAERAAESLRAEMPGLTLSLHALAEWDEHEGAREACRTAVASADIVIANMVFLEDHVRALEPWLAEARDRCDAVVGCMAAGEIVRATRLGALDMSAPTGGLVGLLKRLRGAKGGKGGAGGTAGERQMRMLRRLPKLLRFVPGKAQDLRSYFLALQYMLAGSDENIADLVRHLVSRYASGERALLRDRVEAAPPREYPETGLYHPDLPGRVGTDASHLPTGGTAGTVGLLVMRSYVLAGNTAHYDGVIRALEARGLNVVPAFSAGLDARPAIEAFFHEPGERDGAGAPRIDALVSLTGFSLVGGPAYNDAAAAETALRALDVPYHAAHAIEFQSLEAWHASAQGLTPVETTMMVALPEIDGATNPTVFGGRSGAGSSRDMVADAERCERLAGRVARQVALRRTPAAERRVGIVLYGFPPNAGAVGTAAHLSVFRSLLNTLRRLREDGHDVDVPPTEDALREAILAGNAERFGQQANVAATIDADTHVARETHIEEIEAAWGAAPGPHQSDGRGIHVLGARFGNVMVGVQPAFGVEGDPMRLLFEGGFAPTHAFAAFYRFMREDFGADVLLHFGTHGALEFMPGKQSGLSGACWPERLLGEVPNVYLYAANNPSEATIAKRRSAATIVSHLTPPVTHAGLYKGLGELRHTLDAWRGAPEEERASHALIAREQAVELDLIAPGEACEPDALTAMLRECEEALIPHGLHVVGEAPGDAAREDWIATIRELARDGDAAPDDAASEEDREAALEDRIERLREALEQDHELPALSLALAGRYVPPVAGGDVIRSPHIAPTGRNVHGFDPFRLPSAHAVRDGMAQAERLLARHRADHGDWPRRVAMVLWGTDNLKSEGQPIGQALALMGARPRFDGFGRLAGADLVPLEELGRPRIDCVVTLSGIFRDLLPLQTRMLAEAAHKAATADEPVEANFVRAHALQRIEAGEAPEEAALRVFSNAAGTYGSNVSQLIDSALWDDGDELAATYSERKCFAYGMDGRPRRRAEHLAGLMAGVEAAYQNLESVELGVTSIDHYFDTLGGIARSVAREGGRTVPVYVGDQTRGSGKVRTLDEQVALEARTRMLNPKWYEGLLDHGHEGVRQIEASVTNTLGWSATTGAVAPWVYRDLAATFVLDPAMRERLADLNPRASARLAGRLVEAQERAYWDPDPETLDALLDAADELEDRVEGIREGGRIATLASPAAAPSSHAPSPAPLEAAMHGVALSGAALSGAALADAAHSLDATRTPVEAV